MVIGGFASLTMLTKNSFLDEINKQYVLTARAKGVGEKKVLYGHIFRNAMLIVISGFPAAFINNGNKYQLHFGKPFIVPYFDNQAQSIQHGLKVLSKSLENLIKLDPNQWHSIQPVWTSEY